MTFSPTHLANFLACRHTLTLELEVRRGLRERPNYSDPLADQLRKRGQEHEQRYVNSLRARGLAVEDLTSSRDLKGSREASVAKTMDAMRRGVDVIVQAPLGNDTWFGYADVLVKVPVKSDLGDWSYEAHDTKLARDTRAGAILQLCVYSELLGEMQGRTPDHFHIVTPAAPHTYRVADVSAYCRLVKWQLLEAAGRGFPGLSEVEGSRASAESYPDPVEHCAVCRWWETCNAQRRKDDHIQFVANLGRSHKREFETHNVTTLKTLAEWTAPEDFKPKHGSRQKFVDLQDQAWFQHQQRTTKELQFRMLPLDPHVAPDGTALPPRGLKRLSAPSPGDLYLDLEADPFGRNPLGSEAGEGSREYLFGLGWIDAGAEFRYRSWWAFHDQTERRAFEEVMSAIADAIAAHPDAHVYHYASYESTALKRLAGRYSTCAEPLDELLRAGRLTDLYAVVRESVRAGVEGYSIKDMEQYYGFERDIDLRQAGRERQTIEVAIESGDTNAIPAEVLKAVEGYNRDDVRSTWELQRWLEARRDEVIAAGGDIPRPGIPEGKPSEEVKAREQRVRDLRARLLEAGSANRAGFLMAYLLDWHRREEKSEWWEFFRLRDLSSDDLLAERKGVAGLAYVERVEPVLNKRTGKPTGSVIDRYTFPPQDCDFEVGDTLRTVDGDWATVWAMDRRSRLLDVKVGKDDLHLRPFSAFAHDVIQAGVIEDVLFAIGSELADGVASPLAMSLLDRIPPPMPVDVRSLSQRVLAIQGPPGTGKTYRGGVMICDLVEAGKTVGVTAHSHTVITNILRAVRKEAESRGQQVPILQIKHEDKFDDASPRVVGGTTWHWCSAKASPVDVMVVDEAGQMSLANALACTRSAGALVLLGDPQQLDQPTKGVHPDGVGVSALQHWLGEDRVMSEDRGGFLNVTWRLAPAICDFTSETFYLGRLESKPGLEGQVLQGVSEFSGAGLRIVPVEHDGNRNASDEEVAEIVRIVACLLAPSSEWVNEKGEAAQLRPEDIRVIAPYNAQVSRLRDGLPADVPVGTVDRFQGQEAPVVIYSMATSQPEDAPRGMQFLYSLNRLNVATSRARCMCILVANPRLFAPDCQLPLHMQLANALCRYRELAG